jgi:hypothetical protein
VATKQEWDDERNRIIDQAKEPATKAESGIAAGSITVKRGYSETIREVMRHLDMPSSAEHLQEAKDAFRAPSAEFMHGESRQYPVTTTPEDWFSAFDAGFDQGELAKSPALISMLQDSRSESRDALIAQLPASQSTETEPDSEESQVAREGRSTRADRGSFSSKVVG